MHPVAEADYRGAAVTGHGHHVGCHRVAVVDEECRRRQCRHVTGDVHHNWHGAQQPADAAGHYRVPDRLEYPVLHADGVVLQPGIAATDPDTRHYEVGNGQHGPPVSASRHADAVLGAAYTHHQLGEPHRDSQRRLVHVDEADVPSPRSLAEMRSARRPRVKTALPAPISTNERRSEWLMMIPFVEA